MQKTQLFTVKIIYYNDIYTAATAARLTERSPGLLLFLVFNSSLVKVSAKTWLQFNGNKVIMLCTLGFSVCWLESRTSKMHLQSFLGGRFGSVHPGSVISVWKINSKDKSEYHEEFQQQWASGGSEHVGSVILNKCGPPRVTQWTQTSVTHRYKTASKWIQPSSITSSL